MSRALSIVLSNLALGVVFSFAATATASESLVRVPGTVSGFVDIRKDNIIDGAIVLPSLRAEALLRFDIENLIAPGEPMRAGPTTVNVPGNFFFPRQSENYGIFPVTIEKAEFGFYTKRHASEELTALWFTAPFSKLIEIGEKKAPYYDALAVARFKSAAFLADNEWAPQPKISMTLNKTLREGLSFQWTRAQAPERAFDVVVNFQKTPASRWALTDFAGKAPQAGKLRFIQDLQNQMKVLFLRVYNDVNNKPSGAQGFIRTADSNSRLEVKDLPLSIQGARFQDGKVFWQPIDRPGWMAVLRHVSGSESNRGNFTAKEHEAFKILDFGLTPSGHIETVSEDSSQWVDARLGEFEVGALGEKESVVLLFIGTSKEVAKPSFEAMESEPPLFTYAQELNMVRVK